MKQTILLIHGGLHDPSAWDLVIPKLEALSYPVAAVKLPTSNPSAPNLTPYDDVAAIHEIMLPVLDEGKEIVVIAHSYGACPGLACVEGNSIVERKEKGLKGGVKEIMFISSVLITEKGKSCADSHYDAGDDWADIDMSAQVVKPGPLSKDIFYNDMSDEEAEYRVKKLHPHALSAFTTPIQYSANDLRCPCWYLMCDKDQAVKWAHQERMLGLVKSMKVERLSSGHSPMLSMPDVFVEIVDKVASS